MPPIPAPFLPMTLTLGTPAGSVYSTRSVAKPKRLRTTFKVVADGCVGDVANRRELNQFPCVPKPRSCWCLASGPDGRSKRSIGDGFRIPLPRSRPHSLGHDRPCLASGSTLLRRMTFAAPRALDDAHGWRTGRIGRERDSGGRWSNCISSFGASVSPRLHIRVEATAQD